MWNASVIDYENIKYIRIKCNHNDNKTNTIKSYYINDFHRNYYYFWFFFFITMKKLIWRVSSIYVSIFV